MKTLFLAAVASSLMTAAPALAAELEKTSTRLPDDSKIVVVSMKQGGFTAPGVTQQIVLRCPVKGECVVIGSVSAQGPGMLEGVPSAIVGAIGLKEFGRSLRPDQTDIWSSSYSDSSSSSNSGDDATVNSGGSGNDYSDDGKG